MENSVGIKDIYSKFKADEIQSNGIEKTLNRFIKENASKFGLDFETTKRELRQYVEQERKRQLGEMLRAKLFNMNPTELGVIHEQLKVSVQRKAKESENKGQLQHITQLQDATELQSATDSQSSKQKRKRSKRRKKTSQA